MSGTGSGSDLGYSEMPYTFGFDTDLDSFDSDLGSEADDDCRTTTLFSTPDHLLFELLESGTLLDLSGS